MKTSILLKVGVITVALALGFGACETTKDKPTACIRKKTDGIVIPGCTFSPELQGKVLAILQKYDNHLYKIQPYDKGKALKPIGKLSHPSFAAEDAEFAKNAVAIGLTSWTTRIGLCSIQHRAKLQHG